MIRLSSFPKIMMGEKTEQFPSVMSHEMWTFFIVSSICHGNIWKKKSKHETQNIAAWNDQCTSRTFVDVKT